jgi:hypothetical protein
MYARKMPNQQTEAAVKVAILNRFMRRHWRSKWLNDKQKYGLVGLYSESYNKAQLDNDKRHGWMWINKQTKIFSTAIKLSKNTLLTLRILQKKHL